MNCMASWASFSLHYASYSILYTSLKAHNCVLFPFYISVHKTSHTIFQFSLQFTINYDPLNTHIFVLIAKSYSNTCMYCFTQKSFTVPLFFLKRSKRFFSPTRKLFKQALNFTGDNNSHFLCYQKNYDNIYWYNQCSMNNFEAGR